MTLSRHERVCSNWPLLFYLHLWSAAIDLSCLLNEPGTPFIPRSLFMGYRSVIRGHRRWPPGEIWLKRYRGKRLREVAPGWERLSFQRLQGSHFAQRKSLNFSSDGPDPQRLLQEERFNKVWLVHILTFLLKNLNLMKYQKCLHFFNQKKSWLIIQSIF